MDILKLKIVLEKYDDKDIETVCYEINGDDFIQMIRQFELPFGEAEKHPDIAGGYQGLTPEEVLPPSQHLLGKPEPIYGDDGWTQILTCSGCREPGCWPLFVKITVDENKVKWSNFEQTPRGPKSSSYWNYDKFGPFVFDRKQYEEALNKPIR